MKRMRLSIGSKLNAFFVILMGGCITAIVTLYTTLFTGDLPDLLRKQTLESSSLMASRIRGELFQMADKSRLIASTQIYGEFRKPETKNAFIEDALGKDKFIASLASYKRGTDGKPVQIWRLVNATMVAEGAGFTAADFDALNRYFPLNIESSLAGKFDFKVAKTVSGVTILRVSLPLIADDKPGQFSHCLVMEIKGDWLKSAFTDITGVTGFVFDERGTVLGSSDSEIESPGSTLKSPTLFQAAIASKNGGGQLDYEDQNGNTQIAAFSKVGFANLTVVSQTSKSRVDAARAKIFKRTVFLAAAFLFLAIALGFWFSEGLVNPIKRLAKLAEKIAKGNLDVKVFPKGKPRKAGDEIHQLSLNFENMILGLKESSKMKDVMAKFHSPEIADKLLKGQLSLGGERKQSAIMFCDIRNFTTMSESLNPVDLVKLLNRYMTVMVNVILKNGGVIDKFIGDAILAYWGIPNSTEHDSDFAIKACLEMRIALNKLNKELKADNMPELYIGMGINFGPVVVGTIGSPERMEYTIIGDTVNTATRVESATKEFDTDLLISHSVFQNSSGRYLTEECEAKVLKGKSGSTKLFKVLGYIDSKGQKVIVDTKYSKNIPGGGKKAS